MNKDKVKVTTYSTETLEREAAENIITKISELVAKNNTCLLLLSGGSLVNVYQQMASNFPDDLKLDGLVVALVDERNVKHDSPDSNEVQIFKSGLLTKLKDAGASFIGILLEQVNVMNKREDFIEVRNNQYKCLFLESEAILGVFGVGTDGHTAGILPMDDEFKFRELFMAENYLISYSVHPLDSVNEYRHRITLSVTAIKQITDIVVYAKGKEKLKSIYMLMEKESGLINEHPVEALKLITGSIEVITDQEIV